MCRTQVTQPLYLPPTRNCYCTSLIARRENYSPSIPDTVLSYSIFRHTEILKVSLTCNVLCRYKIWDACRFVSRMCFLVLSFRKIGRKMWELWEVEISPLPLKRHIAYTAACCYRTSRDSSNDNWYEAINSTNREGTTRRKWKEFSFTRI